jgi:hypothetical protein
MNRIAHIGLKSLLVLGLLCGVASGQGRFFREYWAEFDAATTNHSEGRWRVNDGQVALHPRFGLRWETKANGLILIDIPENLLELAGAQLYLELWGGHPRNENKRFVLNGHHTYVLDRYGTEEGNCTYSHPEVDLRLSDMVTGVNAFQFACDKGECFWGHYMVDNARVRCELEPNHPDLTTADLADFSARVRLTGADGILAQRTVFSLEFPEAYGSRIVSVDYVARYAGFDDKGLRQRNYWHDGTLKRVLFNHVGTVAVAPYTVAWDTAMIPDQTEPVAIKAVVRLERGFCYETPPLEGLRFPPGRSKVRMYACGDLPTPFASRVARLGKATIRLPGTLAGVERAELWIKIWNGGAGQTAEPFKINGYAYDVADGVRNRNITFTRLPVAREHLRPGDNEITLLCDTEHHGMEIVLPGPVLLLKWAE